MADKPQDTGRSDRLLDAYKDFNVESWDDYSSDVVVKADSFDGWELKKIIGIAESYYANVRIHSANGIVHIRVGNYFR